MILFRNILFKFKIKKIEDNCMINIYVIKMKFYYLINYFVIKKLVSVEFCYMYIMIFECKDLYKLY